MKRLLLGVIATFASALAFAQDHLEPEESVFQGRAAK